MKNFNISMQILDGTYIHQAIKKREWYSGVRKAATGEKGLHGPEKDADFRRKGSGRFSAQGDGKLFGLRNHGTVIIRHSENLKGVNGCFTNCSGFFSPVRLPSNCVVDDWDFLNCCVEIERY